MKRKRKAQELSLFSPRCDECGQPLLTTESGYLACPMGHGKLVLDAPSDTEACGSWFNEEIPANG